MASYNEHGHLMNYTNEVLSEMSFDHAHLYDYITDTSPLPLIDDPMTLQLASAMTYDAIPEEFRNQIEITQEDIHVYKLRMANIVTKVGPSASVDFSWLRMNTKHISPAYLHWLGETANERMLDEAIDFYIGATMVALPFYR